MRIPGLKSVPVPRFCVFGSVDGVAIQLIEEAVQHTESPSESIPFLLRRMDCEMNSGNAGASFMTGLGY